jgi:hypothetical protein
MEPEAIRRVQLVRFLAHAQMMSGRLADPALRKYAEGRAIERNAGWLGNELNCSDSVWRSANSRRSDYRAKKLAPSVQ